ncbi:MAG: hypothetical protein GXO16_08290 [Epsilonproteobacteria bacterium]|nr:hypothetical protein [Campylobacterota bacterium]
MIIYGLLLLFLASSLPIGPVEAKIIFLKQGWLHELELILYRLAPQETLVRLPQILVTLVNVYLYYRLSLRFLKPRLALFSAVLFSLLPAVLGAGVIVNEAPFIIFLTLVFLFLHFQNQIFAYIFALFLLFFDNSFSILFLSMALYYLYHKNYAWIYFFALFFSSVILFGFDVSGKPKTYFLDTFLLFSAIFSPLLFFYYFYVIYRILIKEDKNIIWFISATSFLFALVLSFRQRIYLIDFAPFAVIGTLLMVKIYFRTLRVRLRKYRRKHIVLFWVVLATLLGSDLLLIFHAQLFGTLFKEHHFAYRNYLGFAVVKKLKEHNLSCVSTPQRSLQAQLQFYGIFECPRRRLTLDKLKGLEVRYRGVFLGKIHVSNSNSKKTDVTKINITKE